jgi:hypothetical protein
MATTTPNFGWTVPTSTDLVKDGATAIETLGDGIDASFVGLKGGTTGQVLSKTSGTDLAFTWVAQDDSNAIQNSIVDAKGDLIAATANDTPARLAIGTNGQVLTADSTASTGIKWAAPAAGALSLIQRTTFTDVANTGTTFDGVFTSTYKSYQVVIEQMYSSTAGGANADKAAQMELLYSGTAQTTSYYGGVAFATTPFAGIATSNAAQAQFTSQVGYVDLPNSYIMWFGYVGNSSQKATYYGLGFGQNNGGGMFFGGGNSTARTYTGFRLKAAAGNVTGTVAVYGIASA